MLEIFGVVTGLLYLLLEIRQHKWMWVVCFLTALAYIFVFYRAKIYADMGLQIYYVAISIYGFIAWGRKGKEVTAEEKGAGDPIVYRHLTPKIAVAVVLAILLIWGGLWYLLSHFTDSPIPVGDAFSTSVGIVATWMVARCIIEHWYFWIVVNFISVYLYFLRDLYPTMFLYLCYGILAVVGLYTWKKKGVKTI